jgi:23S rRNA pseudouridine955/2504/2580 synthase
MTNLSKASDAISESNAAFVVVGEASVGQRVDNFLTKILKGVPKSHIYRILRSGEVRVNKKRVDAAYKLVEGDWVRVPPIRVQASAVVAEPDAYTKPKFEQAIIYEDDAMLVLNKPAGMAVHGGSGVSRGVIEQLRLERPQAKFLELVHRLDRETSGVLMVAKKRSALVALHDAMRHHHMNKRYLMLVVGQWQDKKKRVQLELLKHPTTSTGERRVSVQAHASEESQSSETIFHLRQNFKQFTLLEAQLITGRTHQLRVQLAHLGFPIAGDDKYGDFSLNKALQKRGLKRMFLHSSETGIRHPLSAEPLKLIAPLAPELQQFLSKLQAENSENT